MSVSLSLFLSIVCVFHSFCLPFFAIKISGASLARKATQEKGDEEEEGVVVAIESAAINEKKRKVTAQ